MRPGDSELPRELARIRQLASELAAADSGPAGELACALAEAVLSIADRVEGLWQLIVAVVDAADKPGAGQANAGQAGAGQAGAGQAGAGTAAAVQPDRDHADENRPGNGQRRTAGPPPAEFVQALASGPGSGHQGVRLSIGGRDWVAAISQEQGPPDPASAWSALERLARTAEPDWPDPPD